MSKPLHQINDAEIVNLLRERGHLMTYVARNWLSDGRTGLKTAYVRRRLEQLERQGLVERHTDHPYATQIGWRLPKA
ncbi:hypothetical protein [Pseudomonas putida]|uniref:hypothetical protein n=1 Tax=Pseudomonas putida TaxID=303 RepID=UPI00301B82BD